MREDACGWVTKSIRTVNINLLNYLFEVFYTRHTIIRGVKTKTEQFVIQTYIVQKYPLNKIKNLVYIGWRFLASMKTEEFYGSLYEGKIMTVN